MTDDDYPAATAAERWLRTKRGMVTLEAVTSSGLHARKYLTRAFVAGHIIGEKKATDRPSDGRGAVPIDAAGSSCL